MTPKNDVYQAVEYFSQTMDPTLAGEIAQAVLQAKVQEMLSADDKAFIQTFMGRIKFPVWKASIAAVVVAFVMDRNARTDGGLDIGGLAFMRAMGAIQDVVEQAR